MLLNIGQNQIYHDEAVFDDIDRIGRHSREFRESIEKRMSENCE